MPARCCSTATSIDSRFPSKACAIRRGIGAPVGATSDCTSTHRGRVPSMTVGHDRTGCADPAVGEEECTRIVDRHQPVRGHLHESELVGRTETMLQRTQHAQRVMPITLEREHGVDDMFQHPRPGERAVLGDVADQHGGDVVVLGEANELLGAVAHLGDRARCARRVGIVHGLDGIDGQHHGLDLRRRTP